SKESEKDPDKADLRCLQPREPEALNAEKKLPLDRAQDFDSTIGENASKKPAPVGAAQGLAI
ncbi:MAG: hypothetical protein DME47_03685, partial [Verrucomicrobia bacterium]